MIRFTNKCHKVFLVSKQTFNSSCFWIVQTTNSPKPSNKSEKFPVTDSSEIPQNWSPRWKIFVGSQFWDSVSINSEKFCGENSSEFLRNTSPEILRNTSPEIPEKFLGLGHHDYGFLGEFIKRMVSRKSWKFLPITSPEIPEKFVVLGHQVYWFLGKLNNRIHFEKFLGISPEFYPKKFLRNSPECFSGNSSEILRIWSRIFRGIK